MICTRSFLPLITSFVRLYLNHKLSKSNQTARSTLHSLYGQRIIIRATWYQDTNSGTIVYS